MAYSTWLFPDNVFGPQQKGPDKGGANDTQYPNCGFNRIYTLENILYGLEFVVTPLLQTIATGGSAPVFFDETGNLSLTGGSDPLPAAGGTGTFLKVSIYNLSTNSSVTVRTGAGTDFILESGVSMDLNATDPTAITILGTASNVIQLVYTYKV